MKWRKQPYIAKAGTHRAGWKFWDLETSDGSSLCFVRYIPDKGYSTHAVTNEDLEAIDGHWYTKLGEAQAHCVAYFINKFLEEE